MCIRDSWSIWQGSQPKMTKAPHRGKCEADVYKRQERVDFHERVRQAYLERWHSSPGRIRVIDAQGSIDEIRKLLEEIVSTIYL